MSKYVFQDVLDSIWSHFGDAMLLYQAVGTSMAGIVQERKTQPDRGGGGVPPLYHHALNRAVVVAVVGGTGAYFETLAQAVLEVSHGGANQAVLDAVAVVDETSPRGQAGPELDKEQQNRIIEEILQDAGIDPETEPETAEQMRTQIRELPMTIVDGGWPGKEMMEIEHFNDKAVVRLNHRHPFIRDVYDALIKCAGKQPDAQDKEDVLDLVRRASLALQVLFLAYAKAENLHRDPALFDDLRSYWGLHTASYMSELEKHEQ